MTRARCFGGSRDRARRNDWGSAVGQEPAEASEGERAGRL